MGRFRFTLAQLLCFTAVLGTLTGMTGYLGQQLTHSDPWYESRVLALMMCWVLFVMWFVAMITAPSQADK